MLAYTGAPRNSGTNNWEITKRHLDGDRQIFDCFERIRDTAAAMRTALERGDWDEVGRQIAIEWDNRKRLAPGVTTPTIDDLIARAHARRRDGRQGVRRRRRRLPVLLRPAGRARGDRRRAGRGRRAPARLPDRDGRPAAWITSAIARILREIADLLEIKGDNPFKIRAYRNGADIVANHPHDLATLDETGLREIPGIGKDLAARIREIAETGDAAYHRELVAEFPPTILDLLHLQGVGPKTVATLYRELGIRTLDDLERAALDGRIRALHGMGAKKEALILKALEERKRHAGRHLLPDAHDAAAALVAYLRERAPDADHRAGRQPAARLRNLRRHRHPRLRRAGVADGRVRRVPAGRARARPRRHEVERAAPRRLPGRSAARRRRKPRRGAAVLHRLEGAQHRAARPRDRPRASS